MNAVVLREVGTRAPDLSDWNVVADVLELQLGRCGPEKANERGDD